VVPFNHSIHHYRDMPVVLASAAIFLLAADFVSRAAAVSRASPALEAAPSGLESSPERAESRSETLQPDSGALGSASMIDAATNARTFAPGASAPSLTATGASSCLASERLSVTSASPPARPSSAAKRNDEASHGPSRDNEKASSQYHNSAEKRHADVT